MNMLVGVVERIEWDRRDRLKGSGDDSFESAQQPLDAGYKTGKLALNHRQCANGCWPTHCLNERVQTTTERQARRGARPSRRAQVVRGSFLHRGSNYSSKMGRTSGEIRRSKIEKSRKEGEKSRGSNENQAQEPAVEKGYMTRSGSCSFISSRYQIASRTRRASSKDTTGRKLRKKANYSAGTAASSSAGSKSSTRLSGGEDRKIRIRKKRCQRLCIRKRAKQYVYPKICRKHSDVLYRECLAACYQYNEQLREMRDEMKVLSLNVMWSARFPDENCDTSGDELESTEVPCE